MAVQVIGGSTGNSGRSRRRDRRGDTKSVVASQVQSPMRATRSLSAAPALLAQTGSRLLAFGDVEVDADDALRAAFRCHARPSPSSPTRSRARPPGD